MCITLFIARISTRGASACSGSLSDRCRLFDSSIFFITLGERASGSPVLAQGHGHRGHRQHVADLVGLVHADAVLLVAVERLLLHQRHQVQVPLAELLDAAARLHQHLRRHRQHQPHVPRVVKALCRKSQVYFRLK